jgi:Flp pilus assembly pilin Flp
MEVSSRDHSRCPIRIVFERQTGFTFVPEFLKRVRAPRRARDDEGGETHMTFYGYLTELIAAMRRREEGQTMAEYGVILAVITVAVIAALVALSTGLFDNLMSVVDAIS